MPVSRVLVTGASGFLGRPLAERLSAHGCEVHGVTRGERDDEPGLRWHRADLRDPTAAADVVRAVRPDVLVHAAWSTEAGLFTSAEENERWRVSGEALLEAALAAGVRRIVGVGSCAEYDWDAVDGPLAEDAPLRPATPYGAAKAALGTAWRTRGVAAGVSVAWARPFFLFGPRESSARLVPSVVQAVLAGRPAPITSGRQVRDVLHVDDAAAALAALTFAPVDGAVNVGAGAGVSLAELSRAAARLAGDEALLQVGGLPDRQGEPAELVADVTRLRREVGAPPPRPLEDGLGQTVAWWRGGA